MRHDRGERARPWPGGEGTDVLEAQLTVLGDLADVPTGVQGVPFLVQLPGRGPGADATGRTTALLPGLPVELGPHGWKLADHGGADLRRAEAYLREDVEALAIAGAGYAGPLAVTVTGPWTLAAEVYLARGDRVLSDRGAVHEVVEALAAGVAEHVAQVRRQVPGADVVVQVDEPLLAQVGAGVLPTFSGYSRLRAVPGPDLVDGLRPVLDAARAASASTVVHVGPACGRRAGRPRGRRRGRPDARRVGRAVVGDGRARGRARRAPLAALPPAKVSQCAGPALGELADLVSVPWRRIGLEPSALDDVTLLGAPRSGGGPGRGSAARPTSTARCSRTSAASPTSWPSAPTPERRPDTP